MKQFMSVALLIFSLSAAAQTPQKEVVKYNNMKIIDSQELKNGGTVYLYGDKCDKMRFIAHAGLGAEIASKDLLKLNAVAEADYFFKQWVSLHAGYQYSFIDLQKIHSNNENTTNNNESSVTSSSMMEAGARVLLYEMRKRVKHAIVLERHRGYNNYSTYYYIAPKLPARRIITLRGGWYANTTVVNTDLSNKDGNGTVMAKDGALLSSCFTNAHSMGGYAGVSLVTMIDAVTKNSFKKGNVFKSRSFKEIYADVLYAGTTFDPVTNSAGIHDIIADATGSFQTSKLGCRIGIKSSYDWDGFHMMRSFEVGSMPGVKGTGLYINFAVGLQLLK